MRTRKTDAIFAVIAVSALLFCTLPLCQESEAANENWLEKYLADIPSPVPALTTGDADNDGEDEIVIGTWSPTCEVRIYEKVSGTWVEDLVTSTTASVYSIAIGDCDNDGQNEVVIGMVSTVNELRAYQYNLGSWHEDIVDDTPGSVFSIDVGDADSDGQNEVVCGLQSSSDEVRSYKKHSGGWISDTVFDAPTNVRAVRIGDCDNDGTNEIVMAMDSSANEVRAFENVSGVWMEDIIADASNNVYDIDIGDCDDDLKNEVVIGIHSSSDEVRAYEKSGGGWVEDVIHDIPSSVWDVEIGDCDNDGVNEVIIGMLSCTNELRAFELSDEGWTEEIIGDTPADIFSVAVSDCDNDGINEIAIGMWASNFEVRLYEYDIGQIIFTSHKDGDYINDLACFDVVVTSGSIQKVRFYLNNELVHVDYTYPYQYIMDTTMLAENAFYNVKAEAYVANIPPLVRAINVKINNIVETGSYLSASTLRSTYRPGEDVSVCIITQTPPLYNSMDLIVVYSDPNGNRLHSQNEKLPYASRYLLGLPIHNDADLGTYTIEVIAYGYENEEQIWYATSQTTFEVSGESLFESVNNLNITISQISLDIIDIQSRVMDIQSDLDDMSISQIRDDLHNLNQTFNNKINGVYGELWDLNSSLQSTISNVGGNILDSIGGNGTLRSWLEPVLAGIESGITQANSSIMGQLTQMEFLSSVFYSTVSDDLTNVYNLLVQMETDLTMQLDIINRAICSLNVTVSDAPKLSTEEVLEGINDSISIIMNLEDNMMVHDNEIKGVLTDLSYLVENENHLTRNELLGNLSQVAGQLETLRSNMSFHDSNVKDDLLVISEIVTDLENKRMSDLESDLLELYQSISSHNTGIGHYILVVDQSIQEFERDMDERLRSINNTLKDLDKLDAILGDIKELDSSVQTTNVKASAQEDNGQAGTIIFLSVLIVISLVGVLFLLSKKKGLKESLGFGRKTADSP